MTNLLKIAGITADNKASAIKVDELGRIEMSRTVEPKRIIGNVLEPYAEGYRGPVSVFGLELYAINSERGGDGFTYILPTPDGWLMSARGALLRYDSKGAIIWEAEVKAGLNQRRERMADIHGGHVYTVIRNGLFPNFSFMLDKISYKTGKVVMEGPILDGLRNSSDLVYIADIDRLVGVIEYADMNKYGLIYVHPETLNVEYSVDNFTSKLNSIFSTTEINSSMYLKYESGVIYVLIDNVGVATAKIDADIEVTVGRLVKKLDYTAAIGAGFVLNGDVYGENHGVFPNQSIYRNGVPIYTRETTKTVPVFRGGTTGNLALMADGNKVLAFDKDNLVMSVEIPHEILIMSIAGDSMGNIFVATSGGIYILGDTLQIKGYQLVV